MSVKHTTQKVTTLGGRFEWCPECITRCRKIPSPATSTGYIYIGFRGKWKVCTCDGTRAGFKGVNEEFAKEFCRTLCRSETCPYRSKAR